MTYQPKLDAYELHLMHKKRHLCGVVKTTPHRIQGRVRESVLALAFALSAFFSFHLCALPRSFSPCFFRLSSQRFFLAASEITRDARALYWQAPGVRLSARLIFSQLSPAFAMRSRIFTSAEVHAAIIGHRLQQKEGNALYAHPSLRHRCVVQAKQETIP